MSTPLPLTDYTFLSASNQPVLSLILPTCQWSARHDVPSKQRGCRDMEIFSLSVSLWWMSTEVWQWVGQVSPCGAVSYRSSRVSGAEMSINMHIKSDPSAGGMLSLAEERKVKLAYITMMVPTPEDRVFSYLSLVRSQSPPKCPLIGFDFCLRGD